jgi:hypothetical protein
MDKEIVWYINTHTPKYLVLKKQNVHSKPYEKI